MCQPGTMDQIVHLPLALFTLAPAFIVVITARVFDLFLLETWRTTVVAPVDRVGVLCAVHGSAFLGSTSISYLLAGRFFEIRVVCPLPLQMQLVVRPRTAFHSPLGTNGVRLARQRSGTGEPFIVDDTTMLVIVDRSGG